MILDLYKVLVFPVPLNSSSTHATQITNLPPFIAISKDGNNYKYVELSTDNINACLRFSHALYCSSHLPLNIQPLNSCPVSLFTGNKSNINANCNFGYFSNRITPAVTQLNETHFLVFNTSDITLDCPDRTTNVSGCHFCIITVPCNCSISTVSSFIPPRLSYCHHHSIPVTVLHPVNLALLQQFFNEEALAIIEAHDAFESPLNITIPSFNMFQHNFSTFLATEKIETLNLKKMAEAAKNDQEIYSSLAEPILALKDYDIDEITPSFILSIVSSTLSILCLPGIIYLYFKYRRLASLLALTHITHPAQAANLPSFIYTTQAPMTTTTTLAPLHNMTTTTYSPLLMFAAILFVFATYRFLKYCFNSRFSSTLILEITDGTNVAQIPCLQLPPCIQHLEFSGDNCLPSVQVKISITSTLILDFGDFKILNKFDNCTLSLNPKIMITPLQAYKVNRLTKHKFSMYLWINQNGICIPVNVKYSSKDPPITTNLYPEISTALLQH